MADVFIWSKATLEERRQRSAATSRRERLAQGKPGTVQDDAFYATAARILSPTKSSDRKSA